MAVTIAEYAVPAVPPVKEVVEMASVAGAETVMVKLRCAMRWWESVTLICTFDVLPAEPAGRRVEIAAGWTAAAAAPGGPVIVKVEVVSVSALEVKPEGSPVTVQEKGAVPPLAVTSHE